jgi:hypothetical protein
LSGGLQPYNQELLEALAELYRTDPASLIMRNPADPDAMWSLWDQAEGGPAAGNREICRVHCDTKCYELAAHFLADEPRLDTEAARTTLASAIQQAIQDEIHFMQTMMEKA